MKKVEMPLIEASNISKKDKKTEVKGFSANVSRGDSIVVLHKNPDGAALVTELLSGRSVPEKGKIYFKGDFINGERNIFGVVAKKQKNKRSKTLADNAASVLVRRGLSHQMSEIIVRKEIDAFGLGEYADSQISALSDATAARAEIYSAYMCSHEVVVIDEPFSELDGDERKEAVVWLNGIMKKTGLSVLAFTESVEIAVCLASSIAVVNSDFSSVGIIGTQGAVNDKIRQRVEELLAEAK